MVNLLSPPFWTPISGDGAVYPGAKANFYRTGTTTRQDTYADFGLTTVNANPVVADADGAFAPIYLSGDYDYKLVLTDANDAIIKTVDPIPLQSFQTTVVLNGSQLDVMPYATPQGRLTLTSGTPVLSADVTGAATLYYAPYVGNLVPVWDGSNFVPTTFAELSNITTNSATGKAGPAVVGPYQVIDAFVWVDSGTVRLTRGPKWIKTATVTITIAAPGVVTWTSHGLYDGATIRFTTTGALPTGLTASTDYFVTVVDANTFKLSTTIANQVAGTFITTSGSQSGVHTGENYTLARGTGAGTTELERYNGLWVNKYDIVNGPLARKGTYVGSVASDASSQINWQRGAVAAGGTAAILGVWNAYNRVRARGLIGDSTNSWTYLLTTVRAANNSPTIRASFLQGLQEEYFTAEYQTLFNDGTSQGYAGVGYRAVNAFSGRIGYLPNSGVTTAAVGAHTVQQLGWGYMSACEAASNSGGTGTWFGDNNTPTINQTGLTYDGYF